MHLDTARGLEFCSLRCRLFFKDIFFTLDMTWSRWCCICRRRWWRGTWRAWLGFWIISHGCWWWWPIWWWWRWCDLHFHFRWPLWVWPLFFSHQCHWRPCRNFWTNNSRIKIRGGKLFCLPWLSWLPSCLFILLTSSETVFNLSRLFLDKVGKAAALALGLALALAFDLAEAFALALACRFAFAAAWQPRFFFWKKTTFKTTNQSVFCVTPWHP